MALYVTRFERFNFGYTPTLCQSSDVVFETDIPFDNDHLEEFDEVMYAAMRKQNPQFLDPHDPIPGRPGWSTVLGGHKIDRIG